MSNVSLTVCRIALCINSLCIAAPPANSRTVNSSFSHISSRVLPKIQGGLGIQNLDVQNRCLLSKWLFKLINEDGLWQKLLQNKYLKDKTIGSCSKKPTDSHFSKGLMNVKDTFMGFGSFKVKDGSQTCFWMDTWLGNQPLKIKFPSLFNIVRRKQTSMASVLAAVPLNISFRLNLAGRNLRI